MTDSWCSGLLLKIRKSQNFKNGLCYEETDSRVYLTKILRLYSISFEIDHKGTGLNVNKASDRKSDFGFIFSDPNYLYSLSFTTKLRL